MLHVIHNILYSVQRTQLQFKIGALFSIPIPNFQMNIHFNFESFAIYRAPVFFLVFNPTRGDFDLNWHLCALLYSLHLFLYMDEFKRRFNSLMLI